MPDDYLWDGKGEPDPDVERLERALRPLRYTEKSFEHQRSRPAEVIPIVRPRPRPIARYVFLLAAAIAVCVMIPLRASRREVPVAAKLPRALSVAVTTAAPAFPVERIEGVP